MGSYISAEHRGPLLEKAVREVTGPLFDRAVLNRDVPNAYDHLVRAAQHGNPNLETMRQQLLELVNQMLEKTEGRTDAAEYLNTLKQNIENANYEPVDMSAYASETVDVEGETVVAKKIYPVTEVSENRGVPSVKNEKGAIEEVTLDTFKHGLTKDLDDFVVMCYYNLQKARDLGMPEYNEMRNDFLDEASRRLMDKNLSEKDVQLLEIMKSEFVQ